MSADDSAGRNPHVFVSYAHDSVRHKKLVMDFVTFLWSRGIRAECDQWDSDKRRDWSAWVIEQMMNADFIVIVASPDYRRAGDGTGPADRNKGAQSEAALLRDQLHGDRATWLPKLLPVVLPGRSIAEIPLFLQPECADRYEVSEFSDRGAEDLLRVLTQQPAHRRPPLGSLPDLPPRQAGDRSVSAAGTGSVSQSGAGTNSANTGVVMGDFTTGT